MRLISLFEAAYPSHPGGKVTNPNDGSRPGDKCPTGDEGELVLKRRSPRPFEKEAFYFLGCSNYPKCLQHMAAPTDLERGALTSRISAKPEAEPKPEEPTASSPEASKHTCEPEERQPGESYKDFFSRKKNCEACQRRKERRLEAELAQIPKEPEQEPESKQELSLKSDPSQGKVMQVLDVLRGMPHGWVGAGRGSSGKAGVKRQADPGEVRRSPPKHREICKVPGCDRKVSTEFGRPKPFCSAHIEQSPYIQNLMKRVEAHYAGEPDSERNDRERAEKAFRKAEEEYDE